MADEKIYYWEHTAESGVSNYRVSELGISDGTLDGLFAQVQERGIPLSQLKYRQSEWDKREAKRVRRQQEAERLNSPEGRRQSGVDFDLHTGKPYRS